MIKAAEITLTIMAFVTDNEGGPLESVEGAVGEGVAVVRALTGLNVSKVINDKTTITVRIKAKVSLLLSTVTNSCNQLLWQSRYKTTF